MGAFIVVLTRLIIFGGTIALVLGAIFKGVTGYDWLWVIGIAIALIFVQLGVIEEMAGKEAQDAASTFFSMTFFLISVLIGAVIGGFLGYGLLSWFGVVAGVIVGAIVGSIIYFSNSE